MDFFFTLNQILALFLIVLVGLIFGKLGFASESFRNDLNSFLINISLPCTIIQSMLIDYTPEVLHNILWILFLSFCNIIGSMLLAKVFLPAFGRVDDKAKAVYRYGLIFSNFGFMGMPICQALFGEMGLLYAAVFGIPYNIVFYIYGAILMDQSGGAKRKISWRDFVTPINISIGIGLILFCTQIKLPTALGTVLQQFSNTTTPLAMAVAGMLLSTSSFREAFKGYQVYLFSFFRLLVIPAIGFGILKLCGFSGILLNIPVIMLGMPVAANVTIMAAFYNSDSYLAARLVFVSTLLSVISIPIIALFLL